MIVSPLHLFTVDSLHKNPLLRIQWGLIRKMREGKRRERLWVEGWIEPNGSGWSAQPDRRLWLVWTREKCYMGLVHSRKKVWFKSKGIGEEWENEKQRTRQTKRGKTKERLCENVEIVCKCAKPLMFKSRFLAN